MYYCIVKKRSEVFIIFVKTRDFPCYILGPLRLPPWLDINSIVQCASYSLQPTVQPTTSTVLLQLITYKKQSTIQYNMQSIIT